MNAEMQITTRHLPPDEPGVAAAAGILRSGGLVAFPTETVYGLGADATNVHAVAALYAAKGRPRFNPLIAHVADSGAALRLGRFTPDALRLAEVFWPGPLTLVVPVGEDCPVAELARAGLPTLAIRVPDHPVAHAILAAAQRPIVAPSANRSGHVSPSDARHVMDDLGGRIDAIVDGGPARIGVESTIVGCLGARATLLRSGGIPRARIERVLGHPLATPAPDDDRPRAPGRLASHYAPRQPLRLDAGRVEPGEACLGFGLPLPPGAEAGLSLNLSERGDLSEAAANLYRHLRRLDSLTTRGIAVATIPAAGLGEAIRDRLARAAAPKGDSAEDGHGHSLQI